MQQHRTAEAFQATEQETNVSKHLALNRGTLLVVDDDWSVREILARVLAEEGYLVLVAANGSEALEIATTHPINVVLLDLNMPQQNGWDTFEKLAILKPLLPVVVITARSNQVFASLAAGAAALLEKPLDYPKLIETVRSVLAEPEQVRFARMKGRRADFRYFTSRGETLRK